MYHIFRKQEIFSSSIYLESSPTNQSVKMFQKKKFNITKKLHHMRG